MTWRWADNAGHSSSQHYLMASNVLQQTDMVMTVPERFARFAMPISRCGWRPGSKSRSIAMR